MKTLFETILALFLVVFFLSGCILQAKKPVCETDQPSILCEAAKILNVTLDDVATVLKLSNITGLSTDAYSAQEAFDYIQGCQTFVQTHKTLTWGDFVREATSRYLNLSPTVQALFELASDSYEIDIAELEDKPLTEYDYYLILLHLDKQKALVVPFLLTG